MEELSDSGHRLATEARDRRVPRVTPDDDGIDIGDADDLGVIAQAVDRDAAFMAGWPFARASRGHTDGADPDDAGG